ncbi:MAG: hypothetical protein ACI4ED_00070 [Suilimivivens sp.]
MEVQSTMKRDYLFRFYVILREELTEDKDKIADKYHAFRTRWY